MEFFFLHEIWLNMTLKFLVFLFFQKFSTSTTYNNTTTTLEIINLVITIYFNNNALFCTRYEYNYRKTNRIHSLGTLMTYFHVNCPDVTQQHHSDHMENLARWAKFVLSVYMICAIHMQWIHVIHDLQVCVTLMVGPHLRLMSRSNARWSFVRFAR